MTNVFHRDDKESILFYFAKPHNFGDCPDDGYDNQQPGEKGRRRGDTNYYDYGGGGDNDKAVDVP